MWVGEILDAEHKVAEEYFLRGPSIKIGRSVENSLVFSADKSISRVHAEILVDKETGSISIVDLASRYGSSANGVKIQANVPFQVENGVVARFGVGNVRIRFVKRYYAFCTTRLEKPEKDRLKKCAKAMNGRIVSQIEHATHVVCNKAAATVKLLTALVVPLKIITADWIGFMEGSKAAELIPKEEEFAPAASDDIVVYDPKQSRSALLQGYTIFLLNAADQQYFNIGVACGATVVQCYMEEEESGLSVQDIISRQVLQTLQQPAATGGAEASRRFCLFFDESRGVDCDKILMSECRDEVSSKAPVAVRASAALTWLTAGQLAAAIINFTAPNLLADPPRASKIGGGGHSYSQSQQTGALQSQYHALPAAGAEYSQQMQTSAPMPTSTRTAMPAVSTVSVAPGGASGRLPLPGAHQHPSAPAGTEVANNTSVTTAAAARTSVNPPHKQVSRRVSMQETSAEGMTCAMTRNDTTHSAFHTAAQEQEQHDKENEKEEGKKEVVAPVPPVVAAAATLVLPPPPQRVPVEVIVTEEMAPPVPPASSNKRGRGGNSITSPMPAAPAEKPATAEKAVPPRATGRRKLADIMEVDEAEAEAVEREGELDDALFQDAPNSKRARVRGTAAADAGLATAAPTAKVAPGPAPAASRPANLPTTSSSSSSSSGAASRAPPVSAASAQSSSSRRAPAPPSGPDDGCDWIPALRGEQRAQVMQTKKTHTAHAHSDDDEDVEAADRAEGEGEGGEREQAWKPLPQPEVVETLVLLPSSGHQESAQVQEQAQSSAYRGYYRIASSSERLPAPPTATPSSAAASANAGARGAGVRNVKLFRKNSVSTARAADKMSFTSMQVVLPKESEREIQLRLEAEARQEMEKYADQMLSDKFTAQSIRKVFSKA